MSLLPVSSFTQWGNLRQVLVGNADNACFQPKEQPSELPKINDPYLAANIPWPEGRKSEASIQAANKQLDNFSNVLRSEGVNVVRPAVMDWSEGVKTPWWQVGTQYCSTCPRDTLITFGNIVMEAPMSRRDRFFEVYAYRSLLENLWRTDKKMLWRAAPKSSMADCMYDEWVHLSDEERAKRMGDTSFCLRHDSEVVFDAADFTRTGKHVFGQISTTTNAQGVQWMDRDLEPHGFKVRPIRFHFDLMPSHLDCTFVVLRPGTVLTNPARPIWESDKEIWMENDWEFIDAPLPVNGASPAFCQSTNWLSMNVFSISAEKVVVEKEETALQAVLEDHGFQVIPMAFRDVYEFGGGLNCSTWDITRDDTQVDLFKKWLPEPEQYPGLGDA
jgi:glycine amidinotransferase